MVYSNHHILFLPLKISMGVLHIVLISFDNLTGTEVVLLGKREAQLSSCYSQIALRVNL